VKLVNYPRVIFQGWKAYNIGMEKEVTISLDNVSKCFKRYDRPVDRLKEILFPSKSYAQEFWALQNISFEIMKGETMGIIGRNGAGKSTLLQLICGTLTPTAGSIQVNGRVAALLELGAGFNPEFTGRDNVYMNGAIMGLSKQEVNDRFDRIAAFADIKDFIDQPVKTYSSGMYVRLAFAAAIHVDPDILIIDEALAVGDMFFQAKCMARMRQMIESGVTVLFVSHDVSSVKSLCRRTIYLKDSCVHSLGRSGEIVDEYVKDQFLAMKSIENCSERSEPVAINFNNPSSIGMSEQELLEFKENVKFLRKGNGLIKIANVILLNNINEKTSEIEFGQYLTIKIFCQVFEKISAAVVAFYIKDKNQVEITGSNNIYEQQTLDNLVSGEKFSVDFKLQNRLRGGAYSITIIIADSLQETNYFDWVECATVFNSRDLPDKPLWSQVSLPLETCILRFT
jgi:lipopolysaccharide transport system ATP-binding protein